MNRNELLLLLPKDKFDFQSIENLKIIGFPDLTQLLPELLQWIQDMNWPVAKKIILILQNAGPEIVEEIKQILLSDDHDWIYWIVEDLLPNLSREYREQLQEPLLNYAEKNIPMEYKENIDEYLNKI